LPLFSCRAESLTLPAQSSRIGRAFLLLLDKSQQLAVYTEVCEVIAEG